MAGKGQNKEKGTGIYKNYIGDKEAMNNSEGIKRQEKKYYRYYKPTFYVFL